MKFASLSPNVPDRQSFKVDTHRALVVSCHYFSNCIAEERRISLSWKYLRKVQPTIKDFMTTREFGVRLSSFFILNTHAKSYQFLLKCFESRYMAINVIFHRWGVERTQKMFCETVCPDLFSGPACPNPDYHACSPMICNCCFNR